ncbi:hypothetical protein RJZ56_002076 [Blastomyces dermatitidis]
MRGRAFEKFTEGNYYHFSSGHAVALWGNGKAQIASPLVRIRTRRRHARHPIRARTRYVPEGYCTKFPHISNVSTLQGALSGPTPIYGSPVLSRLRLYFRHICRTKHSMRSEISYTGELTVKDRESNRRIQVDCQKCDLMKVTWSEMQLRSADEGSTIFYRCPKCGNRMTPRLLKTRCRSILGQTVKRVVYAVASDTEAGKAKGSPTVLKERLVPGPRSAGPPGKESCRKEPSHSILVLRGLPSWALYLRLGHTPGEGSARI